MFRNFLFTCVFFSCCSIAVADQSKSRGVFIGGGLGISTFDDGGAFAGFSFDDEDSSFQIQGGYKFLPYFALEGRYVDLGTFTVDTLNIDLTAASIHAVGIVPFGESGWELFGQLGLGVVNFDLTGLGDEDEEVFAGGIGVRFSPTSNFSLAIQTDVYVWEDNSLGPVYDLAVGGTQLTIQYIF